MSAPVTVLSAETIEQLEEVEAPHPLNPRSGVLYRSLSEAAGLQNVGFHLLRLPPGKEANELHTHHFEEEFYYVLRGRGLLLLDDEQHEMGPGAFVGFPAPSAPHLMTNPFDQDLVYLVGGERSPFEVAEFPRHGKMAVRERGTVYIVDSEHMDKLELGDPDS